MRGGAPPTASGWWKWGSRPRSGPETRNPMTNFLGIGFKFPFSVGPNGAVQLSPYQTNIEEPVGVITRPALGERQMRPEWGCRIHDFVFAPNNTAIQTLVAHHVEEALAKHEYRLRSTPT